MVAALEWAVAKRDEAWTTERELAATTAEILHAFMLSYFKVNGGKNVGKPMHVERPWEKNQKPQMLSPGAFAAMVGGGRG
jgi:hypothetical protein